MSPLQARGFPDLISQIQNVVDTLTTSLGIEKPISIEEKSIKKIDDVEIVESGDDGDDDYEVMDSVHAVYPKCSGNKAHICSYHSREIGEY